MILKPVMRPAMRSPMGSAMDWGRSNDPNAEAIALLRKFNASVWLFGSGNVGGLQAGNYLDSTLGTPASIDGPIGGVMDALGTVGPELNAHPGPFTATTGYAYVGVTPSAVSGSLVITNISGGVGQANYSMAMDAGKTYLLEFSIMAGAVNSVPQSARLQTTIDAVLNVETVVDTNGVPKSFFQYISSPIAATLGISLQIASAGAAGGAGDTASASLMSVKEVTGNHATQPTTANKPVLRVTGGKYYGEFDGINDSLLTGNLALTNTFSIVVAGNLSSLPSQQTLIGEDTGGAQVYVTSGGAIVFAKVGTGVLATTAAGEVAAGVPFVATATLAGGNAVIRKNGVQKVSTASAVTLSATTGARIGGTFAGAEFCVGSMSAVAVMQGVATDAEKLTVEKWAADLTPGGPTI